VLKVKGGVVKVGVALYADEYNDVASTNHIRDEQHHWGLLWRPAP